MEICNRVSEYVNSIDSSTHWRMRDISITEVSLDTSKIPGWLATKVKILGSRYAWLLLRLPTLYPTLILISGYIIAYLSYFHRINITHHATVKIILLTLGCMALIRLLSEIHESYEISKIGTVNLRFRNPTFNYKWFSLKGIFRCYGIRYAITSALSIMLLYFAVYSV
ncbi:hypothetical protein Metme_1557 [Methylomonas methanica MC09]|uniref:Uncharacterized protein n=1 Tax=Methylomonas methanica (strain DSM 25384 / MC09) TaxID=857087 RepID=G0A0P2_METMM|nr:hypothetical protein Metme_1557 [Methylomonas methanica MC09]